MKKLLCLVLVLLMACSLAACAAETAVEEPEKDIEPASHQVETAAEPEITPEAVVFTDPAFEAKVRTIMTRPEGVITVDEAAAVTELNLANQDFGDMNANPDRNIKSIADIRYFTGLEILDISFNDINGDLSPLAGLTSLKTLVFNGTTTSDLSPLAGLTNMECLIFCWNYSPDRGNNGVGNLEALAGMINLEALDAKNAGITDVSALAGLPKLREVQLNDNQITDVSPLAEIENLRLLLLEGNPVEDYSPLDPILDQLEGKDF